MKYEFKQEDAFSIASYLSAETKEYGDELQFKYCPFCDGGSSRDKFTFSINLQSGAYCCLRASCGESGHFVQMARHFGYELDFGITPKEYRQLPQHEVTIRPAAVSLLAERGISEETVRKYHITAQANNHHVLVFPFYDDKGTLKTVKYRNARFRKGIDKSKEWFEADTQPILFGMDNAKDYSKPLVITEGQIDALSLAECGVSNTVSVPNGCSSFTWVSPCYEYVNRFPYIIVMGDNENGKITLVDKISKSFKLTVYCVQPDAYYGLKDANDILREYGKDALLDSFSSATEYTIPHIVRLADVQSIDFSTAPKILSGIQKVDETLGGFYMGQVVLLTGRRGEGKSTLMGQLILEAIDQGNTVLSYSGELTASHFKNWIDLQAAGADGVMNLGSDEVPLYTIKPEIQSAINEWYRPYALLYDNEAIYDSGSDEQTALLSIIEDAVIRYGINMVCIDNLMTAMDLSSKDDLYRAQSTFVLDLKRLAVKYNIVILLVAHPRKELSNTLTADSVSGSADIVNRVDSVLIYSRDSSDGSDDTSRSCLQIVKNRMTGKLITSNPIRLVYSESSKRITPLDSPSVRHYGWEKSPVSSEPVQLPF